MHQNQLQNIEQLEDDLWEAADQLRANSKLTSSEYCMPVLGVIFLRHAGNRYKAACAEIAAEQAAGTMAKRPLRSADFIKRRALMLPKESLFEELLALPDDAPLGTALVKAMEAVERDFPPLKDQLPKDYEKFENDLLEDLLKIFDREALRTASGDVFGRIYEYFLMKFAIHGAQDNGEFFTPPSLVQTIVNVIEPDHGTVFDPACGSGGMFVQSSHFIESRGEDTMKRLTFYGQEKTATTIRLAKMNLAVHGLEGKILEANTFYDDEHRLDDGRPLWGNCDFVMANPPFNVDMVDAGKVKDDRRLPFGLPGVNKAKKVSNGNYLWISYFHSYLGEKGRAGFVMSSQASSAGRDEATVRQKIVETGDVDVMISIRSNFFYTRTVPCELWFFDKGKPAERRDKVLMIDARHIYRKVTRKIYDFSPEQLVNLTSIVWLHRGETQRHAQLLSDYDDRWRMCRRELDVLLPEFAGGLAGFPSLYKAGYHHLKKGMSMDDFIQALDPLVKTSEAAIDWCKQLPQSHLYRNHSEAETRAAYLADSAAFRHAVQAFLKVSDPALEKLRPNVERVAWKDLGEQFSRVREMAERTMALLTDATYWIRQIDWHAHRFPDGRYRDVPGLCKAVTQAEIKAADWSLTPGRYVGVAPVEDDEDFDFEQTMREIHAELKELNAEAVELAGKIDANFEELV